MNLARKKLFLGLGAHLHRPAWYFCQVSWW